MPFLSIIIPHYNLSRELLTRCIKSIIEQDVPSGTYEIIVVDDGSDKSPEWLYEEFGNDAVRVITIAHAGPGAARNRGIEEAKGQYIQFVDADDCLQPNSINSCLKIIELEQPKIFRFNYRICHNESDACKSVCKKALKYSNTISGAAYLVQYNLSGSPCTYFFQRDVAMRYNIRFETQVYHEDEEFNTKLHFYATSLIDSNAIIYNYCIRKESITSNSDNKFEQKRIGDLFKLLERLCKFRKEQEKHANKIQMCGLNRKLVMLTVDTILNLLYDGKDANEILKLCNTHLRPLSLYPLPNAGYSIKYRIFRLFANNRIGICILRMLISKNKPPKK